MTTARWNSHTNTNHQDLVQSRTQLLRGLSVQTTTDSRNHQARQKLILHELCRACASTLATSDHKPSLRVSDRISEAVSARPTMPRRASIDEVDQHSLVRIDKGRLALMLSSFSGERCPAFYVQLWKPKDGSPGTMTLMMSPRRSRRDV